MNTVIAPGTIARPAASYAHAVLSDGALRWLHTSGAVPTRADGSTPGEMAEQAQVVWANIAAILTEAAMSPCDIVSVTTYVVRWGQTGVVSRARYAE